MSNVKGTTQDGDVPADGTGLTPVEKMAKAQNAPVNQPQQEAPKDVTPESVIGARPTRVLLEYPDGHTVQVDGANIAEYQGTAPASSNPYNGEMTLRLKTSTAQYQRKTMRDWVS